MSREFVVRVDRRTGKLRTVAIPLSAPQIRLKTPPAPIAAIVNRAAQEQGVDPLLVHSIIQVESNYDASAVSPKGAEGLMQLMPSTARMLGVSNGFDPGENIEAGVKYLKYLQGVYKDDRLALAAYNAGPGAVEKYRKVPPYPETQKYVEEVGRRYAAAKDAAAVRAAADSPGQGVASDPVAAQTAPVERHPEIEQFIDENGGLHLKTMQ